MWDTMKCVNINVMEVQEGEEWEKGKDILCEKIMVRNFPNLMENFSL